MTCIPSVSPSILGPCTASAYRTSVRPTTSSITLHAAARPGIGHRSTPGRRDDSLATDDSLLVYRGRLFLDCLGAHIPGPAYVVECGMGHGWMTGRWAKFGISSGRLLKNRRRREMGGPRAASKRYITAAGTAWEARMALYDGIDTCNFRSFL